MCGIAGGMSFSDKGAHKLDLLPAAVQSLHLRGPDQSGVFRRPRAALGQSRLSVIDLSDAAAQPFTDISGRYTLVFNGEIYNYREIRRELTQKGIRFRSESDTEVLLYAYIVYGPAFVNRLNGFFAFCIFDEAENSLFLARDRMGIKPLYYYHDNDVFLFASEMKALVAMGIPREPDTESIFAYLQLNYIPGPASIFKGVQKAEPGHTLRVKKGAVSHECFYSIPYNPKGICGDSYETACGRIRELMDTAVQRRLVADVPLGTFLSGGIDSSIITGLAARHKPGLKTFSIGFPDEPLFDETRHAETIARLHRTDHQSIRLSSGDLLGVLPRVLDYIDEPFADSSALAVYLLSRETRRQVTVALSGDGADELYGGYIKHMAECRMRNPGMKEKLVKAGGGLWAFLPKSRNSFAGNRIRQLHRFAEAAGLPEGERYWRLASISSEGEAASLLSVAYRQEIFNARKQEWLRNISTGGDLNEVLLTDMQVVLRNDMLVKVDLMSMANSLEVRVPFLDHEHVNYVFSLPWFYKAGTSYRKKILKDAFREMLPDEIFRRNKHGFEVPLLKWFRTELDGKIRGEWLSSERIRAQGIFDEAAISALIRKLHSSDPGDSAARVWALIVFQNWWTKYME